MLLFHGHIAYLHELHDVVLIAHLAQLHNNKKWITNSILTDFNICNWICIKIYILKKNIAEWMVKFRAYKSYAGCGLSKS